MGVEQLLGLLRVRPGPGDVAGGRGDQAVGQLLVAPELRLCGGSPGTTARQGRRSSARLVGDDADGR
jgi:hypothetical protein